MDKHSIHRRLLHREQGYSDRSSTPERPCTFLRHSQGDPALIRRLKQIVELQGHKGGVDTVTWNSGGTLLASGCDDCRIKIWDARRARSVKSIECGHTQNISCVRFLPETSDTQIVSCSADRQVRLIDLNKQAVRPFHCHHGRVKSVAAVGPDVFLSGGEDGMISQFDKRVRSTCYDRNRHSNTCCTNLLVEQRAENAGGRSQSTVGINSLAVDPLRPHFFATGGLDPIVRLFDRRMIRSPDLSSSSRPHRTPWVACFIPSHFKTDYAPFYNSVGRQHSITSIAFTFNGADLVASYSSERIYSFSVAEHALELASSASDRLYMGQSTLRLRKHSIEATEEEANRTRRSRSAAAANGSRAEVDPPRRFGSRAGGAASAGEVSGSDSQARKRSHLEAASSDAEPSGNNMRSRARRTADAPGGVGSSRSAQSELTSQLAMPMPPSGPRGSHPLQQGIFAEASFFGQGIPMGIEASRDAASVSLNLVLPISLSMMPSPLPGGQGNRAQRQARQPAPIAPSGRLAAMEHQGNPVPSGTLPSARQALGPPSPLTVHPPHGYCV